MTVAVLPASFDPITSGHVDIVTRAGRMFDRLVVAVFTHPKKNLMFDIEDRVAMVRESLEHLDNVEAMPFSGLLVDFARSVGATVAIRGIRTTADFEYEYQQAVLNRRMYPEFDVVSLFPSPELAAISSTMVKEIAENGGDVSSMVPAPVLRRFAQRAAGRARASGG